MAELYFNLSSDYQEAVRLRDEIIRLKNQLARTDREAGPEKTAPIEEQLQKATLRWNRLITEAMASGDDFRKNFTLRMAEYETRIRSLSEQIGAQKQQVARERQQLERLNLQYNQLGEDTDPATREVLSGQIRETALLLDQEESNLLDLQKEQVQTRVSAQQLNAAYETYQSDGLAVIGNNTNKNSGNIYDTIGGKQILKQFISDLEELREVFEKTDHLFTSILGNASASGKLLVELGKFASTSAFGFGELAEQSANLLTLGVEADKVIETLDQLTHIAFATNTPLNKVIEESLSQGAEKGDKLSYSIQQDMQVANEAIELFYKNYSSLINNSIPEADLRRENLQLTTQLETIGQTLHLLIREYGTYQAAIIATTAQQEKETLAMMGEVAATAMLSTGVEKLTETMIAKGASVLKSNPWIALAAVAVLSGKVIWEYASEVSVAEKAQERLNEQLHSFNQGQNQILNDSGKLTSILNDQTQTLYAQVKAYEELVTLIPDLEKLSFQQFKTMPQNEQRQMIHELMDKKEILEIEKFHSDALAKARSIRQEIDDLIGTDVYVPDNEEVVKRLTYELRVSQEEVQRTSLLIQQMEERQWQANTPLEEQIRHHQTVLENVRKEKEELEETINKQKELKDETAGYAGILTTIPDLINNAKWNNLVEQENALTTKISSLQGKTPEEKNYYDWLKQYNDATTRLNKLSSADRKSDIGKQIEKEQAEAEKYIKIWTKRRTAENTGNPLDALLKLNRLIDQAELNLQSELLASMTEGKEKRIAQVEMEYQERAKAIKNAKEEYIRTAAEAGREIDPAVLGNFNKQLELAEEKSNKEKKAIDDSYVAEYNKKVKEMTAIFISGEEKKWNTVLERYQKEETWAENQKKNNLITDDQYKDYMNIINNAKTQETLEYFLTDLNDFKKRESDLLTQWDTRIAQARLYGDEELAERLKNQRDKELSQLQAKMLQETDEWTLLFSNLDMLTVTQIENLIREIETKLDSADFNLKEVDLNAILASLNKAKQKVIEVNPFTSLGKAVKDIFTNGSEESEKSTAQIKQNWENLSKSTAGCFSFIQDSVNSCTALKEVIGESGMATMNILQNVTTAGIALSAAIKTAEASSVVLAAISAALQAVNLFSNIFNVFKEAEKERQKALHAIIVLQEQYNLALIETALRQKEVFGDNSLGNMVTALEALKKATDLYNNTLNEQQKKWFDPSDKRAKFFDIQTDLRDNLRYITKKANKGFLGIGGNHTKTMDLEEWVRQNLKDQNGKQAELFDTAGRLNVELAQKLVNKNSDYLVSETKESLERLIEIENMISTAEDAMRDYLSNTFGQLGDELTHAVVDAFRNGTDAAEAFHNSMVSIVEDLGQQIIRNFFIQKALTALEDNLLPVYTEFAANADTVEGRAKFSGELFGVLDTFFKKDLPTALEGAEDFLEMYQEMSRKHGYDIYQADKVAEAEEDSRSENSLSGAYAKASQESIDLLAGQTGAQRVAIEDIRTQVDLIRDIQLKGWSEVTLIRQLNEQIENNTSEIAGHTQQIREISETISSYSGKTAKSLDALQNHGIKINGL